MIQDVFSMFFAIAGTIFVIFLTYIASKWYAGKMHHVASGKHIKIIDRLMISNTGSVILIEAGGIQYMVGVSNNNIQLIKQLDEPIGGIETAEPDRENFMEILKSLKLKGNRNEKSQ